MALILFICAFVSSVISALVVGLLYANHKESGNADEEALFFALLILLIMAWIWLIVFAIVFRNSIHI